MPAPTADFARLLLASSEAASQGMAPHGMGDSQAGTFETRRRRV